MKIKRPQVILLTILSVLLLSSNTANAQGTAFTYQGKLNVSGNSANGSYDFRFRLASDPLANNYVGSSYLVNGVPVVNGLFTTTIDFGTGIFSGNSYWLEIDVRANGGTTYTALNPLQPITPAPYAVFAATAGNATTASSVGLNSVNSAAIQNNSVTAAKISSGQVVKSFNGLQDAVTLSAGDNVTITPSGQTLTIAAKPGPVWSLNGNSGTTPGPQYLGTSDSKPLEFGVNGMRAFRLEPTANGSPNVIGGSVANSAATGVSGATVGGGGNIDTGAANSVGSDYSTVGGGRGNGIQDGSGAATIAGGGANGIQASSPSATIGGGNGNLISDNNFASTISGGNQNTIQSHGQYSFIGGGSGNMIQPNGDSPWGSVIGGGHSCTIQNNSYGSVIGGGNQNVIQLNSHYSFVGGGQLNVVQAGAWLSFVGGGDENIVKPDCVRSFIGGGTHNTIQGGRSVIGGGAYNTASGPDSVIPGGYGNTASGDTSFAAGANANAAHSSSFVWSDGVNTTTTAARQFVVRSGGGVIFYSGSGTSGVQLTPGSGSWSDLSDRNLKENSTPVDEKAVLEKVITMPVSTWNYKSQETGIRHIGPMAQDFYAAFNVGEDNRHIATVDEGGVALAAIKGLNEKLEQQGKEKEDEINALKKSVAELKRLVQSLAERK